MKNSQSKNRRVVLLGLDGATFDLLMPWIKDGKLPHMKKLLSDGVGGELESTVPCTTPVAWSTVYTGKNPGKHGVFDFRESFHRNRKRPLISLSSIRASRIWKILNENGRKTILLNLPMTYPPEPLDGIMVGGMMTPSEQSEFTFPAEIKTELLSRFPNYRVDIDIPKYDTEYIEDCLAFLDDVEKSFSARVDALFYLMDTKPWDFLFAVFILPDRIQHLFWKYIDPKDDRFRHSRRGKLLYDRILRLYQLQDEMLGKLADSIKDKDYLFIVSDHGFGGTEAYINVNRLLEDWGYLKIKHRALGKKLFFKAWALGDSDVVKKILPRAFQRWLRTKIRRTRGSFKSDLESLIDYENTTAFFASIPCQGIYLNVSSDDSGSEDYESIRADIRKKLLELTDKSTGKSIIDAVYFREELYDGPYVKWAPDIIFVAGNYSWLGRQHIGAPEPFSDYSDSPNGFHRPNGILAARGPGIKADTEVRNSCLQDIAPTVLYAFGDPIPDGMDGHVLTEIFTPEFLSGRPIRKTRDLDYLDEFDDAYSDDESAKVQERLRSLGYIE